MKFDKSKLEGSCWLYQDRAIYTIVRDRTDANNNEVRYSLIEFGRKESIAFYSYSQEAMIKYLKGPLKYIGQFNNVFDTESIFDEVW